MLSTIPCSRPTGCWTVQSSHSGVKATYLIKYIKTKKSKNNDYNVSVEQHSYTLYFVCFDCNINFLKHCKKFNVRICNPTIFDSYIWCKIVF